MTLPPDAKLIVHYKSGKPNRTLDLGTRPAPRGSTRPRRWLKQAISGRSLHVEGDEAVRVAAAIEALPPKARADFRVQVLLERAAEVVADLADVAPKALEVAGDAIAVAAQALTGNLPGAVAAGVELAADAAELGHDIKAAAADDKGEPKAKGQRRRQADATD